MWVPVDRCEWPSWTKEAAGAWKHKAGHWLTCRRNPGITLWELFSSEGKVLSNQLDLPFEGGLDGVPLTWANAELTRKGAL